jgi:hypothetical protein
VIASLSRSSISSLKHGLNVSVGLSIEAKLDFSPVRVAIRILLCHSHLAIWWVNNREQYEDIPVGQSHKPSKDELSCSPFVEVSNATLGNTGRALDLEIGSVSVRALAREVASVAMVGCRMAIPGHREVIVVCTHPSFRGRAAVMGAIAEHAEMSCLHVRQDNSAIHLYRRREMRGTRTLHCANLTSPEDRKVPLTSTASR